MFVASSEEMREIDKRAVNEYGIPGLVQMENAAAAVLEHLKMHEFKSAVILCGGGNNGGDGFALARLLIVKGYEVSIFCFFNSMNISGEARINYDILVKMGVYISSNFEELKMQLCCKDVVIDAIFGTGLNKEISGIHRDVIQLVNSTSKFIMSIDIPSGICGNTGEKFGECIYAGETVTFGCLKYGHLLSEGKKASGKVYVEDISIPEDCIKKQNICTKTNYRDYPLNLLKKRISDSHKGDYGKIYIMGGSFKMSGAVILAAKAALRAGAGLVTCVVPGSILDRVGASVVEATYYPCSEKDESIFLTETDLDEIIEKSDVIAVGPGLGRARHLADTMEYLLDRSSKPVVIDADGLNVLSEIKSSLKRAKAHVLLTPHPGEMARLTGLSTEHINKNRIETAKAFSMEYGCTVLLKGAGTVIADGEKIYINTTGNPGMATGGSGDVLTGIIAALIGQGYDIFDAAAIGAYIHGTAGDSAAVQYGNGLTAGDILNFLGNYIRM